MNQYRKRPVVIEAIRFTGGAENATPIIDWILAGGGTARWHEPLDEWTSEDGTLGHPASPEHLAIDTLEGTMRADVGDWIIRGVQGEFYPCKPDIFEATYEPYQPPECPAVLMVRGEHHRCEWLAPHPGLAHTNSAAEAIWTDDPEPLAAAWAGAEEARR